MPAPHACTPCLDRTPPTCPQHTQATGMPLAARPLQAVTSMGPCGPWARPLHTTASTPLPAHHCQHITASTSLPAHHCHCQHITATANASLHCRRTTASTPLIPLIPTTVSSKKASSRSVIKKRHQEAPPSRSAITPSRSAIKKRHHVIKKRRHQESAIKKRHHGFMRVRGCIVAPLRYGTLIPIGCSLHGMAC